MARLIVLGSAAAISDLEHDNTHFLLQGDHGSVVLVDCGSNPIPKFDRCGISHESLTGMILTHFHPDHVYGVPIFLMQLWLLGRRDSLPVYGLHHCLHRVDDLLDAFQVQTWPGFFPLDYHLISEREDRLVIDNDDFRITSWPTRHFIPTMGLRIEVKTSGKVVGYSCDTEPAPNIVELARDADLLLHETSGQGFGHSSAAQAGETAAQAHAKRLALIHYNVRNIDPRQLIYQAAATFSGPVELAEDYDEYEI